MYSVYHGVSSIFPVVSRPSQPAVRLGRVGQGQVEADVQLDFARLHPGQALLGPLQQFFSRVAV